MLSKASEGKYLFTVIKRRNEMTKKLSGQKGFLLIMDVALLAFLSQVPSIPVESRTYPLIFIIASLILSVLIMFKGKEKDQQEFDHSSVLIIIFAAATFLYLMLMSRLGYVPSTLIYLYAAEFILHFNYKKPVFWLFPAILTAFMYFVFTYGLSVILPRGSWF